MEKGRPWYWLVCKHCLMIRLVQGRLHRVVAGIVGTATIYKLDDGWATVSGS